MAALPPDEPNHNPHRDAAQRRWQQGHKQVAQSMMQESIARIRAYEHAVNARDPPTKRVRRTWNALETWGWDQDRFGQFLTDNPTSLVQDSSGQWMGLGSNVFRSDHGGPWRAPVSTWRYNWHQGRLTSTKEERPVFPSTGGGNAWGTDVLRLGHTQSDTALSFSRNQPNDPEATIDTSYYPSEVVPETWFHWLTMQFSYMPPTVGQSNPIPNPFGFEHWFSDVHPLVGYDDNEDYDFEVVTMDPVERLPTVDEELRELEAALRRIEDRARDDLRRDKRL